MGESSHAMKVFLPQVSMTQGPGSDNQYSSNNAIGQRLKGVLSDELKECLSQTMEE